MTWAAPLRARLQVWLTGWVGGRILVTDLELKTSKKDWNENRLIKRHFFCLQQKPQCSCCKVHLHQTKTCIIISDPQLFITLIWTITLRASPPSSSDLLPGRLAGHRPAIMSTHHCKRSDGCQAAPAQIWLIKISTACYPIIIHTIPADSFTTELLLWACEASWRRPEPRRQSKTMFAGFQQVGAVIFKHMQT